MLPQTPSTDLASASYSRQTHVGCRHCRGIACFGMARTSLLDLPCKSTCKYGACAQTYIYVCIKIDMHLDGVARAHVYNKMSVM